MDSTFDKELSLEFCLYLYLFCQFVFPSLYSILKLASGEFTMTFWYSSLEKPIKSFFCPTHSLIPVAAYLRYHAKTKNINKYGENVHYLLCACYLAGITYTFSSTITIQLWCFYTHFTGLLSFKFIRNSVGKGAIGTK